MGGLIIAGDRSGSGKTTVTMAILSVLRTRGVTVQAFKVGPDYIDPMFHRAITGRPAYSLDPVLTSESYVQQCFQQHSATASHTVVEGVMGLFDGAGGTDWASTAHVARLLGCPVLLVVDCARLSRSLAAIVYGYKALDPQITIAGVVLNRVGSDRHLAMLQGAMQSIQMPVLGVLHREDAITLPDRHLGLVPTDELSDLPERFRHLAILGQQCFDWPRLEPLLKAPAEPLPVPDCLPLQAGFLTKDSLYTTASRVGNVHVPSSRGHNELVPTPVQRYNASKTGRPIRIGIARDRAFNFYYEDNLALLTHLGAEWVPWSPLSDKALPPNLDGLYLGGGFPELFAEELSHNQAMRAAIVQTLTRGLPTYAECGGLMYLCQKLVDFAGRTWPMVGAIPATTTMTSKLTLGYRQVTVQQASPLAIPGQQFWGHEFHRSTTEPVSPKPLYKLASYPLAGEKVVSLKATGWGHQTVHAAYVHLHWGELAQLPIRFLQQCGSSARATDLS